MTTPASIIEGLRTYITSYTGLKSGAPVWVDKVGPGVTTYGIMPMPGARTLETYLDGTKVCEYPFAFQSTESTADELVMIENSEFYESFAEWLDEQSELGNLPGLPTGKTATNIEATIWACLFEEGQSDTGIYQIVCKLTFEQNP